MFRSFKEHRRGWTLAAIAFLLAGILVRSYLGGGQSSAAGRSIQSAVALAQKPFAALRTAGLQAGRSLLASGDLIRENEALQQQVLLLEEALRHSQLTREELEEWRSLSLALNAFEPRPEGAVLVADVVAFDDRIHLSFFTLNAGLERGSHRDAVIVTAQGLAGRVVQAGKGFSKAVSLWDSNSEVTFRFEGPGGRSYLGIATGDGLGGLVGYPLDADADIRKGDVLYTTGMGIYPAGLPIGRVVSLAEGQGLLTRQLHIETAVDVAGLQKVLLLLGEAD